MMLAQIQSVDVSIHIPRFRGMKPADFALEFGDMGGFNPHPPFPGDEALLFWFSRQKIRAVSIHIPRFRGMKREESLRQAEAAEFQSTSPVSGG